MNGTVSPKLRLIDAQPLVYEGEAYLMLRDPLVLSEKSILVPQPLIPVLALCDGTRTAAGLRASLALRYGLFLTTDRIIELLEALDDALLLENDRSREARATAQREYRRVGSRPPANAGVSYPADPDELSRYLGSFFPGSPVPVSPTKNQRKANGRVRGLVSPHIDYERGGKVYAQIWGQAAQAARDADLAIIFGTDHFSEGLPFSLTRQNYSTPFGILPTDTGIVDALAEVIGSQAAFAGELHHRSEHSIELAAVWLHYIRGGPIPIVPILTGSFENIMHLNNGRGLSQVLEVLRKVTRDKNVIVVAAGDLAHVGPAFEGSPVDPGKLIQLRSDDEELIEAMCHGDADRFLETIQHNQDANNVCGVSPIYLTMRLLDPMRGENLGYAICPADEKKTSVVTICGTVFY